MPYKQIFRTHLVLIALAVIAFSPSVAAQPTPDAPMQQEEPRLQVDPPRIDFGMVAPQQSFSKILKVTNAGKSILKWQCSAAKNGGFNRIGRFFNLKNDDIKESGHYKPLAVYHDLLELSGRWMEVDGYPVVSPRSTLKFHFYGTGIRVYFWKEPQNSRYSVYIGQTFVTEIDAHGPAKERDSLLVAEHLPLGAHVLTVVGKEGKSSLEGFEVYGRPVSKGPPGYLNILPGSGVTTKEVDYVSLVVSTQHMKPGVYGDYLLFASNGGTAAVPLSFEVMAEPTAKILNVYRFAAGSDYFFTTNPQADEPFIHARRYVKEGIAFRLFTAGTPGTVEFYRWYNPVRKSHFYSYNKNEGGKIEKDYILEGVIGHIATTRLKNTRELYRWHHPRLKIYAYSTDSKGNDIQKKGYQFDGIAGYVR